MNWYYSSAGQSVGPISQEEFDNLVRSGVIKPETLVWREGMPNWQPYSAIASGAAAPPPAAAGAPPYPGASAAPDPGSRSRAEQLVNAPAICLIITAVLGILASLAGFLMNAFGAGMPAGAPQGMPPEMAEWIRNFGGMFGVVSNLIGLAIGGFILYGALQMKNLKNRGLATTAAVIAMIPCISPCCLLGLPFGIWALVVLNKPEVKPYFS